MNWRSVALTHIGSIGYYCGGMAMNRFFSAGLFVVSRGFGLSRVNHPSFPTTRFVNIHESRLKTPLSPKNERMGSPVGVTVSLRGKRNLLIVEVKA